MNIKEELERADDGLQMGPLIDVVFLLLIYFIVNSNFKEPEADVGIQLPGNTKVASSPNLPDEQIIEIFESGSVALNNTYFDTPDMSELVALLVAYKEASESTGQKPTVTIEAEDDSLHQRLIDVLSACNRAGIKYVTVGMGG